MDAAPVCNALTITPHPLVLDGQRHIAYELLPGETLDAFLRRYIDSLDSGAWVVAIGGYEVPRALWIRTRPKDGTVIECRSVVQRQALALVAVVALSYFTLGAGGFAAGSFLGLTGAVGGIAAGAAFMAGSILINKVLGPRQTSGDSLRDKEASPTYKLSGGRNRARQYEPPVLLLGELRITPDFASIPYTYFAGDEQYLWSVYHGGINCAAVSDLRIGETPLSQYAGVETYYAEFCGMPDQGLPGWANVDAVAGPSLPTNTWVVRTSSPGAVVLQADFEGSLYGTTSKGQFIDEFITLFGEYREVGTSTWLPFFEGGVNNVVIAHRSTKPLRVTYTRETGKAGQYEVRFNKSDPDLQDGQRVNLLAWSQLKSVQYDTGRYGGMSRMGLNIKASGQLNGAVDELSWLATAKPMPYWDIDHWTVATTRKDGLSNPGAQILLLARGIYDDQGRLIAGLGLPDSQIDIESLKAFMRRCWLKGFTFDYALDTAMGCYEMMEAIAAVGLGSLSRQSGKLGVVFAAEDQPIEGVINMSTMRARSFAVAYQTVQTADGVEYQYFDRDRGYAWKTLRVSDPTVGAALSPARISSIGVTTEAHAAVLARFHLAQSVFQRKDISFETDLEHLTYQRMSLLSVTHDVTQWGHGGRLVSVANDNGYLTLTLDIEVPSNGSGPQWIGLRVPGETQVRVFGVSAFSGDSRVVRLDQAWPAGIAVPGASADNPACDTLWLYDFKATPGLKCRVVSIQPQDGMTGASVALVPEGPEFWDYVWNGAYVPPGNQSLLQSTRPEVSRLRITEQVLRVGNTLALQLSATFDARGNYDHAQVWVSQGGNDFVYVGDARGRSLTWDSSFVSPLVVEVRPMDALGRFGATVGQYYEIAGLPSLPPSVESFTITNGVLSWPAVDAVDLAGYLLRYQHGDNRVWSNAAPLHDGLVTQSTFRLDLIPPGLCTILIKSVNLSGIESEKSAAIVAHLGDVIVENLILAYDDRAAGFPGARTGCSVDSEGFLVADDTGGLFWGDDDAPHFGQDAAPYWPLQTFVPMEYVTGFITSQEQVGSRMTLQVVVGAHKDDALFWQSDDALHFGDDDQPYWATPLSYTVEFRYGTDGAFWGDDSAPFWAGEDSDLFWDSPSAWQLWPGSVDDIKAGSFDFRVRIQGGAQQGRLLGLVVRFDVPDQYEELNDIAIAAAGTRLPIAKAYRSIENLQLTLQDTAGGTATTVRIADKATTGPLIYCFNAAGQRVAGLIDARVQGVRQ